MSSAQTIVHHSIPCAHVVSPGGGGIPNFIAARGLGISVPRRDPRAFDTLVFER